VSSHTIDAAPRHNSGLRASDGWRIETIELSSAADLMVKYHYTKSCSRVAVYRHGLISPSGCLAGAVLWLPPTKVAAQTVDDNWRSVLACSRLVVHPSVPTNGASFLLGASMRAIDRGRWATFVTYADTGQGHTGSIYKATNWTEIGATKASATWVHLETGEQRGQKRGPRNLTSQEMVDAGFVRNPNLPKIKFAHWSPRSDIPDRPDIRAIFTKC
jgi:hypothetical protein